MAIVATIIKLVYSDYDVYWGAEDSDSSDDEGDEPEEEQLCDVCGWSDGHCVTCHTLAGRPVSP